MRSYHRIDQRHRYAGGRGRPFARRHRPASPDGEPAIPLGGPAALVQLKCACGGSCPACKGAGGGAGRHHPRGDAGGRRTYRDDARRRTATVPVHARLLRAPLRPRLREVRLHTDARAAGAAKAINARAFTIGSDIAFAAGQYRPATKDGDWLTAHELAHTVQQKAEPERPRTQGTIQRDEEPAAAEVRPRRRRISEVRSEAADALSRANSILDEAARRIDRGEPMQEDVRTALARYFPKEDKDFLALLRRRVALVERVITAVPVRIFATRLDTSIEPLGIEINQLIKTGLPAIVFPPGKSDFIALLPAFFREADEELKVTRLIHETFHFAYPTFIHHARNPRGNAYAYQAFVSDLAGVPHRIGADLRPGPARDERRPGEPSP